MIVLFIIGAAVIAWLITIVALWLGFFFFSFYWAWRIERFGEAPKQAIDRLHRHPAYRFFLQASLMLLAPIYRPIMIWRSWRSAFSRRRAWKAVQKESPTGTVVERSYTGGRLFYADITALPEKEQQEIFAQMDAAADPGPVLASLQERLQRVAQQSEETSK